MLTFESCIIAAYVALPQVKCHIPAPLSTNKPENYIPADYPEFAIKFMHLGYCYDLVAPMFTKISFVYMKVYLIGLRTGHCKYYAGERVQEGHLPRASS